MRFPAGGLVMYVRGEAGRAGARSYPSTRSRQRLQGRDHQPPQRLRLGTPHLGFFLMLDLPRLLSSCWSPRFVFLPFFLGKASMISAFPSPLVLFFLSLVISSEFR
ncbi:hypothetical protein GW17_00023451 [Ensete ventricosum]|nr:hypothetical protein GW17_00023451 [Ensete ventricosum]